MSNNDVTILRVACRKLPFTQLGNEMLRNAQLSLKARGLLGCILSYPENWQFTFSWFMSHQRIGRDQLNKLIKELERAKHCQRRRHRLPNGTLGPYEYTFTDQPGEFSTEPPSSDWNPVGGSPVPVLQSLYIKKESTNKVSKNPPLSPSGGPSAHPGDEQWKTAALAGLRAGGRHPLAVEHLIKPLLSSDKRLSLGKGAERNALLAEIAEAAGGLSVSALQAAAKRIIEQPKKVTPWILRAEVDQARNHGAMFVIKPGTPQWTRWLEHLDVAEPRKAKVIRKAGVWQMPSEWPPATGERTEAA